MTAEDLTAAAAHVIADLTAAAARVIADLTAAAARVIAHPTAATNRVIAHPTAAANRVAIAALLLLRLVCGREHDWQECGPGMLKWLRQWLS